MGGLTRILSLSALCVWAFWPELANTASGAPTSSEMAHVLVTPVATLLLVYHRRSALVKNLTKGSPWGTVLLAAGVALYAGATWPFSYGYARNVAMIPVLAGAILVACGWRVLKLSVPILLLVLLSLPIGSRIYARLIIHPETCTIAATAIVLDKLPRIDTSVKGADLFFSSDHSSGVIGLGESNRGARLLMAFGMVGVFVVFSRIRSRWRVITAAVAAVPIVLFCNFLRLLCWGLVVIYTGVGPANSLPRSISAGCSLFALVCVTKFNLFVEVSKEKNGTNTDQVIYGRR